MSGSETNKRSVQFSDELGEPEDGKSTTWDTHQLVDFLQNHVGFNKHKAKVVAPVLLKNGYDTKHDLLDASRESLASSGILYAHIDKIFIWIESQKEPNDYQTPVAPPRKRHKPPSPGRLIDDADAEDKNFLETVTRASLDGQQVNVPGDFSYCPKALGPFAKTPMVHTNGQIDSRFRIHSTPVGQQLIQHLTEELAGSKTEVVHVILLGKSGVGKTTAVFDAAKDVYCLFFSASHHRVDMQCRDPGQFDKSFGYMVDALKGCVEDAARCDHIIKAMVLARFLVMYKFRGLPGATPERWMQYQLTEDMHKAAIAAFSLLVKHERKTKVEQLLLKVEEELDRQNCPWFFAYDECQYGYKILEGKCNEWKSTKTGKKRGVSCPFLRIVGNIGRVVIAGTALSIDTADSCISDTGRSAQVILYTDFPPVDIHQIHSELTATLDLTDVELDKAPLWLLEGRGRLFGGLFSCLAEEVRKHPNAQKQILLRQAVEKHYRGMLDNTVAKIKESFLLSNNEEGEDKHRCDRLSKRATLPESLQTLALAALWGGHICIGKDSIKIDLLNIGLCSVRVVELTGNSSEKVYILDEELGKRAILEVARDYDFTNQSFTRALQLSQETKSHAMEPVLVAELARWSQEQSSSATVRKFLETLFGKNLQGHFPSWINSAVFNVKNGTKCSKKDIEYIAKALSTDGDSRGVLLSPSIVKRPDFEAIMGSGDCDKDKTKKSKSNCSPWFLAVSSKLYQKTYDDSYGEDLRSTDPREGFYHKKDGEVNQNCSRLLEKWKQLLSDNKETFDRCLRLHLCLPDVKPVTSRGRKERLWVEKDGSIVAYITQDNVRNIFSESTMSILEHLKVVNLAPYEEEIVH